MTQYIYIYVYIYICTNMYTYIYIYIHSDSVYRCVLYTYVHCRFGVSITFGHKYMPVQINSVSTGVSTLRKPSKPGKYEALGQDKRVGDNISDHMGLFINGVSPTKWLFVMRQMMILTL